VRSTATKTSGYTIHHDGNLRNSRHAGQMRNIQLDGYQANNEIVEVRERICVKLRDLKELAIPQLSLHVSSLLTQQAKPGSGSGAPGFHYKEH